VPHVSVVRAKNMTDIYVSYNLQLTDNRINMQVMTGKIRLPDDLGMQLRERRKALGMSKSELAQRAGKVREVIYRLEAGEDVTVSSLMAVLSALKLAICLEPAGLPTQAEVTRRFMEDDDAY